MNIIAPPNTPLALKRYGGKPQKSFTIHSMSHVPFCVQMRDKADANTLRTTLLSFEKLDNAVLFACLLENHRTHTKSWPSPNIEDVYSMFLMADEMKLSETPDELIIQPWQLPELHDYCRDNLIDMLYIKNISKTNKFTYNVMGQLARIDADISVYMNMYDRLYNLSHDM